MPSTTTNYGWTYPISSDDLNAGATSIGSLATGADTSLKAEATARIAADNSEAATRAAADTALDNAKPNSNQDIINGQYVAVTTNSSGGFTSTGITSDTRKAVITSTLAPPAPFLAIVINFDSFTSYTASGWRAFGQWDVVGNSTIGIAAVSWA